MAEEEVACHSSDGDAAVFVIRKSGKGFPAQVSWTCTDGDAIYGQHYTVKEGRLW